MLLGLAMHGSRTLLLAILFFMAAKPVAATQTTKLLLQPRSVHPRSDILCLRGGSSGRQSVRSPEAMIRRIRALCADASCGRASLDDGWDEIAEFPPPNGDVEGATPSNLLLASEVLLDFIAACTEYGTVQDPVAEVARVLEGLEFRGVQPSLPVFSAGMRALAAGAARGRVGLSDGKQLLARLTRAGLAAGTELWAGAMLLAGARIGEEVGAYKALQDARKVAPRIAPTALKHSEASGRAQTPGLYSAP